MAFTAITSIFTDHVAHVIRLRAEKEMIDRIDANRPVAAMEHRQPIGDGSVDDLPCGSVGECSVGMSHRDDAVSRSVRGLRPVPTGGWICKGSQNVLHTVKIRPTLSQAEDIIPAGRRAVAAVVVLTAKTVEKLYAAVLTNRSNVASSHVASMRSLVRASTALDTSSRLAYSLTKGF